MKEPHFVARRQGREVDQNMPTNFQYAGPAFSKLEPIRSSLDGYQTQYATLENAFPPGLPAPIDEVRRAGAVGILEPERPNSQTNRNAEIYQWSFGFQRLLPLSIVVAAITRRTGATSAVGQWGFTAITFRQRSAASTRVMSLRRW